MLQSESLVVAKLIHTNRLTKDFYCGKMVLELREGVDTMNALEYGLKSRMIYEKFEVQVVQVNPKKFEIYIIEILGYSNDDPFLYMVGTQTALGKARDIQSEVFMYMMNQDFRSVKKSYHR